MSPLSNRSLSPPSPLSDTPPTNCHISALHTPAHHKCPHPPRLCYPPPANHAHAHAPPTPDYYPHPPALHTHPPPHYYPAPHYYSPLLHHTTIPPLPHHTTIPPLLHHTTIHPLLYITTPHQLLITSTHLSRMPTHLNQRPPTVVVLERNQVWRQSQNQR